MKKNPITKLIDRWDTRRELADAIGADVAAVHKWAANGRIPATWQGAVVRAAQEAGMEEVTPQWMLDVHGSLRLSDNAA